MDSFASDPERRSKHRVDLDRKIQLRFDKFQDFLTEIAGDISLAGMFVRSKDLHAPGEQFDFECSLADGFPLVSGRAEVVWVRRRSRSATEPSGMGVRFLELKDKSEALIRRIVAQRVEAGEETFELRDESPEPEIEAAVATPPLADEILAASERLVEQTPDAAPSDRFVTGGEMEDSSEEAVPAPRTPRTPPKPPVASKPTVPPQSSDALQSRTATPREPLAAALPTAPKRPEASPQTAVRPRSSARGVSPLPVPDSIRDLERSGASKLPPSGSISGVGRARSARKLGLRRLIELTIFSLVVGGGMVLVFNQFWVRPRIESLEAKLHDLTGNSRIGGPPGFRRAAGSEQETGRPIAAKTGDPAQVGAFGAETDVVREGPLRPPVRDAVRQWASVWSERNVEGYLSFYSADFVPATGVARAVWEERRRERLLSQGVIRVAVVGFSVEEVSPTEMRVSFTQSYRSDVYRDRVRKTLRMVWNGAGWKIAEEIVVRQLPW